MNKLQEIHAWNCAIAKAYVDSFSELCFDDLKDKIIYSNGEQMRLSASENGTLQPQHITSHAKLSPTAKHTMLLARRKGFLTSHRHMNQAIINYTAAGNGMPQSNGETEQDPEANTDPEDTQRNSNGDQ